jgi:hypothetical protein
MRPYLLFSLYFPALPLTASHRFLELALVNLANLLLLILAIMLFIREARESASYILPRRRILFRLMTFNKGSNEYCIFRVHSDILTINCKLQVEL